MLRDVKAAFDLMRGEPLVSADLLVIKRYAFQTFGWLLLTEAYLVVQFYPVKFFMDEIAKPEPHLAKLLLIAGLFLVMYGVGDEIFRRMDWRRNSVALGAWRTWWGFGNRCILRQSTDWHVQHGTGEKSSLVARNVFKIQSLLDELLFDALPVSLRITFTTILMFILGWQLGLMCLGTALVYVLVMVVAARHIEPLGKLFQKDLKEAERVGDELNRNWRTIRWLGLEEQFADQNEILLRRIWQDDIPRHRKYVKYILWHHHVLAGSRAVLYLMLGLLVYYHHAFGIGTIVLATTWMERSYTNFNRLTDFQRQLKEGKQALKELTEFIRLPPSVQTQSRPLWPVSPKGAVKFNSVGFSYHESEHRAIDGLSLAVEPYSTTALVGPSGCGKSTLMSLLMREYDVTDGPIEIDGVDLRQLDYGRYRCELVAMVSQTIEMFDRSVAGNIRLGRYDATDDDIVAAAKLAGAHDFIVGFENGYDTMVGENGVRLSGGQKQRLAIARALIRQPKILILDEATSSLDALSQEQVQYAINQLTAARTCTIFIIAHRLSTVKRADQVVVMENGCISDIGTHAELQKMNGLYKKLCDLELEKGILDEENPDEGR